MTDRDTPVVAVAAVPGRRVDARLRRWKGQFFAISPDESAWELTESAWFVLRQVDGRRSIASIGEVVAQEYGIPVEIAVADVQDLVTGLVESRVLTVDVRT